MTQNLNAAPAEDTGWLACRRCRALVYEKRFIRDLRVCADCGDHAPLTASQRLDQLLDEGSAEALPEPSTPEDPLDFVDVSPYRERLDDARDRTGLDDAVICARGSIDGRPLVVAAMDFRFMGGSLGAAVGETDHRAADVALEDRIPLIMVTASGGARMQEGVLSLMQMAKTSAGPRPQLDEAGMLTVSLITDPTYGGVAASFATLADVIIAEPGARMGFAGPARHRADDPPEPARGLPDRRVPAGARPGRRRAAPRGAARHGSGTLLAAGRPVRAEPARAGAATLIRVPEQLPEPGLLGGRAGSPAHVDRPDHARLHRPTCWRASSNCTATACPATAGRSSAASAAWTAGP